MSEKNKALARQIIEEIFNGSNLPNLEALIGKDVVIHDTDKELHGLEQLRQGIKNLHTAFPDLNYTIEELLADNGKVAVRCRGKGTHAGSFRGIAPTGKKMTYTVILIWRFENDKMVEHWAVSDVYGMLQQLEVIQVKS
jgi:steroid delta-isomerase-like uncharacterized protein